MGTGFITSSLLLRLLKLDSFEVFLDHYAEEKAYDRHPNEQELCEQATRLIKCIDQSRACDDQYNPKKLRD